MNEIDPIVVKDTSKLLNEWALAQGRLLRSKQTGYVHFHYGEAFNALHHTVPVLENILFVLALFKSRLIENIQEGKLLLKQLLAFYVEQQKNFPVYLHDFPRCHDVSLPVHLLVPFYWILKQFGHVIGSELKTHLTDIAHALLQQSLTCLDLTHFPFCFKVKLAALQTAFGRLDNRENWQVEGMEHLQKLAITQLEGWKTSKEIAELLMSLQLVYSDLTQSPWNELWQRIKQTWCESRGCYSGPYVREWQEKHAPQPHVYDLFMGCYAGHFSKRAMIPQAYHLKGVLVQPFVDLSSPSTSVSHLQGVLDQQNWEIIKKEAYVCTLLEKTISIQPTVSQTYTPLQIIWGNLDHLFSFVCQGGDYENVTYQLKENKIILIFEVISDYIEKEQVKQREIEFFLGTPTLATFQVNQQPTNTFILDDVLQITCEGLSLSMQFHLIEGEGEFFGHCMRSNRPSQIANKAENLFDTYDWGIFLRCVRRVNPYKMQLILTLL